MTDFSHPFHLRKLKYPTSHSTNVVQNVLVKELDGAKTIMADPTSTIFSHNSTNELPDANNPQCKCKLLQYLGKTSQSSEGQHYKKISPKSKAYSLPLSPLVNNNNIYSKKPPSGFYNNKIVVNSSVSNSIIEPAFRIGEKTEHYPGGRFSFSHQRFFYTLTNPHLSSSGRGGLHADERLDIMSENHRTFDNEMLDLDTNEPVFYIGNSSARENANNSSAQYTQTTNSFTNSISRRRKLTQSLSGLSSPGPVRNKLSPVREHVASIGSNAGSPTTPTNPLVCYTTLLKFYNILYNN